VLAKRIIQLFHNLIEFRGLRLQCLGTQIPDSVWGRTEIHARLDFNDDSIGSELAAESGSSCNSGDRMPEGRVHPLRHLACFSPAKSSAPPSKWSSYGNKLVKPKRVDDYPVDVDDMFRHGGAGGRAPLQKFRARNQLVIDQDLHVSASF